MKMVLERKIKQLVKDMDKHTITEYDSHEMVVTFVEEIYLNQLTREEILNMTISNVEHTTKNLFGHTFPHKKEEVVQSFADEVIFHLAFKLTKQGKDIDRVDR